MRPQRPNQPDRCSVAVAVDVVFLFVANVALLDLIMGLCGWRAVGHQEVVMRCLRAKGYGDFDATEAGLRRNGSRIAT